MARNSPALLVRSLGAGLGPEPDADLLERYACRRDEEAFAAIVARHGPLVFGACRRLLGDTPDADDAFQATFVVLARRAGAVRRRESLGCWLYGVAVRVARRALRRRRPPVPPARPCPPDPAHEAAWREVARVIDDELARLPARLRGPLVLCYLHGRTRDEAAAELGWSLSTLKRRLDRGREVLRARLAGRGLAPAGLVGAAGLVWGTAATAVPPPLRAAAVGAARTPTAAAARLADAAGGLLRLKLTAAALLVAAVGLGLAHGVPAPSAPDDPPPVPVPRAVAAPAAPVDPLRPGAVARLGAGGLRVPGGVTQVAFPADGRTVFAGCGEGGVREWDLTTGRELRRFGGPRTHAEGLAVTPDGKLLALGGSKEIEVWDTEAATVLTRLTTDDTVVRGLALSPDGRVLAAWGGRELRLWDLAVGRVHATLPTGPVTDAAFTPDGKLLVTAAAGQEPARLWDVARGKPAGTLAAEGVLAVAVSPDGKTLATAHLGLLVRLFRLPTGEPVRTLKAPSACRAVGFTADGAKLVGVGTQVRVWDVATGTVESDAPAEQPANGRPARVSPDGRSIVLGGRSVPVLRVFDAATGRERFPAQPGHRGSVRHLAFSPDGRTLGSVGDGQEDRLRFWDPRAGAPAEPFREPVRGADSFAWSADGKRLVTAGDRAVVVRDAATGAELHRWEVGERSRREHVGFLGKSYRVVVGGADGVVSIWDPAAGKDVKSLTGLVDDADDVKNLVALSASPDGKWVAAAAFQGDRVAVWDADTGRLVRHLSRGRRSLYGLAFAPDGKALAVIESATVRLYDPADGKELKAFRTGFAGWAGGVAFSPDGRLLAAVSYEGPVYVLDGGRKAGSADHPREGYVRVWEVATGRELRRFRDPENTPLCVAFSPDGRLLATAGTDGAVTLWDVTAPTPPAPLPPEIVLPKRGPKPPPPPVPEADLARHWDALAAADVRAGLRAASALAEGGNGTVAFLAARVKPVAAPDAARLARLLVDLDADDFAARERATADLAALGELAVPALRKRLGGEPSAEFRRRAEGVLGRVVAGLPAGGRLRDLRAVRVLEQVRTAEARELLKRWAGGAAGAALTEDAKVTVEWLGRAGSPGPR